MLALQGELPVRLQLESQVGDGVRRWYPVPWVFQVGTEAPKLLRGEQTLRMARPKAPKLLRGELGRQVHSVVERCPMVPPGVAPVTNRKRLRA